jgi:hypothetical protein
MKLRLLSAIAFAAVIVLAVSIGKAALAFETEAVANDGNPYAMEDH